jgi:sec-independent protein translocase protein TatC
MATAHEGEMPFLDHLEELRWRIITSVVAVVICAIPCGIFWQEIFDFVMIHPLRGADPKPRLIVTAPAEAILLSFKIAVVGGLIAASPVIFYQLWRFVAPGLYKKEKVVILPTVFASVVCFLGGLSFSYLVVPYVITFLARFSAGRMDAMFRTTEYLSFLIRISLAFGLVFELPVVSFILTRLGLLTPRFLVEKLRYAVIIMFILAAILTPPDIISQVFLAVPLLVLYGISILVSYIVVRRGGQ